MTKPNLSPAYDPAPVEAKWYRRWEEAGLFHALPDPSRPPFCITIPPPNVTGELHIGHALCYEIQDLLGRLERMAGKSVLLLPGTDHAGIATQNVIEKTLAKEGLTRHDLGRTKFLEKAWEWKTLYGNTIEKQFRALGFGFDWQRNRFTMDPAYAEAVLEAFTRFYKDGLIYRGYRVINWCVRCKTAISDIEVDDRETEGKLYHIAYPLADSHGEIVVATTRPETMLGDSAIAVHPTDARYKDLVGKKVLLPLTQRAIPIIADEHARPEFGSGAVKITPAHDFDDFEVGRRHDLPSPVVIDEDGVMSLIKEDLGEARRYHNLDRFEARARIIADLQAGGFLRKEEQYIFRLSHCDRCGTILEPRFSLQWFMRMRKENGELEDIVQKALGVVKDGKVRFVPERWTKVYLDWMENIRDWCISRQLWWGHRIPAWYCQKCHHINVAKAAPAACESCKSTDLKQEEDVLDTWFSSALWPFATLGWPEKTADLNFFYPTQMMVTSSQIIFLWVARMIMTGLHFMGDIPFPIVYINATVMNWQGRRMSKSLGTGVDPMEMTMKYGTDAIRFGLIAQAAGQEVRFSEERVEAARNFCNKIWNAARFVLSNIADADISQSTYNEMELWLKECVGGGLRKARQKDGEFSGLDKEENFAEQWILGRLDNLTHEVQQNFARFRFDEVARGLQEFFWGEFCDWYLELAKPGLAPAADPARKKLVQATLVFVLERVLRLLHPYLPFITEEIWQQLPYRAGLPRPAEEGIPADQFIMTAPYPTPLGISFPEAETRMGRLMALVTAVRRLRAERKVPAKEWVNVQIVSSDEGIKALLAQSSDFAHLVHSRQLELVSEPTLPGSPDHIGPADLDVARSHTGLDITVGASGLSDIYLSQEANEQSLEVELARLKKDLEAAQIELERTDANLANESFTSRAPANVIEKTRQRRDKAAAEVESLRQAIGRLESNV